MDFKIYKVLSHISSTLKSSALYTWITHDWGAWNGH